ncbi:hypothetical protein D3C86_1244000 [compost metagenome]
MGRDLERLILEAVSQNGDLAGVAAGEHAGPVGLDVLGVFLVDLAVGREHSAGLGPVGEEVRALLLDAPTLHRRQSGCIDGGDADQRVIERVHPVVDDLASRDDDLGWQPAELVGVQAVEERPVGSDQRLNPAGCGVEYEERLHDTPAVALLQREGVAVGQLRDHPGFEELDAGLIGVRLPEDRRIGGISHFRPDAGLVLLHEFHPQFRDIGSNQADAAIDGRERQDVSDAHLDILLPGAGEGFADHWPPAAATSTPGRGQRSALGEPAGNRGKDALSHQRSDLFG